MLDIGGGFPFFHQQDYDFEEYCRPIWEALLSIDQKVTVRAEPGRFLASKVMDLVSQVVGKATRQGQSWYYVDEGFYGVYNMGHIWNNYSIYALKDSEIQEPCTIAGPTCSPADVLKSDYPFPIMDIGDLMVTPNIGAYSYTLATNFNSVTRPEIVVVDSSKVELLKSEAIGDLAPAMMELDVVD